MFQLHVLSGKSAGSTCVARRFPFSVGRQPQAGLRAEEPGVWDDHLQFDFDPAQGIRVTARPEAPLIVNGQTVTGARLRNGDVLEIGALKLRFWLAKAPWRSQWWRETLVWAALLLLFVGQGALIIWLR